MVLNEARADGTTSKRWQRVIFPGALFTVVAATQLALLATAHFAWSPEAMAALVVPLLAVVSLIFAYGAERQFPFSDVPAEPSEVKTDVLFFALTVVVDAVTVGAFKGFVPARAEGFGGPIAVVVALIVWELTAYVIHRLAHEVPFLWRFHALHHAPRRMTFLNNFRVHPCEIVAKDVAALSVVALVGFDVTTMIFVAVIKNALIAFQHSNAHLHHGILNYVFSTNTVHRWHHSDDPAEGNANYGGALLIWDIVFGTLSFPKDRPAPARLGLFGRLPYPTHRATHALLSPFCWTQCTKAKTVSSLSSTTTT